MGAACNAKPRDGPEHKGPDKSLPLCFEEVIDADGAPHVHQRDVDAHWPIELLPVRSDLPHQMTSESHRRPSNTHYKEGHCPQS